MKLDLSINQIARIADAMEAEGACLDFVNSDAELLSLIKACVMATLRELSNEQVTELFNSV